MKILKANENETLIIIKNQIVSIPTLTYQELQSSDWAKLFKAAKWEPYDSYFGDRDEGAWVALNGENITQKLVELCPAKGRKAVNMCWFETLLAVGGRVAYFGIPEVPNEEWFKSATGYTEPVKGHQWVWLKDTKGENSLKNKYNLAGKGLGYTLEELQ
jgi:hypothetical protein